MQISDDVETRIEPEGIDDGICGYANDLQMQNF